MLNHKKLMFYEAVLCFSVVSFSFGQWIAFLLFTYPFNIGNAVEVFWSEAYNFNDQTRPILQW